jgi:hypothetical protein
MRYFRPSAGRDRAMRPPKGNRPQDARSTSTGTHFRISDGGKRMNSSPADTPSHCLNCETALVGPRCHVCGQSRATGRLTLQRLLHDIPHSVFHVDRGLLPTLHGLFLKPDVDGGPEHAAVLAVSAAVDRARDKHGLDR